MNIRQTPTRRRLLGLAALGLLVACTSNAPQRTVTASNPTSTPSAPQPLKALPVAPAETAAAQTDINPFANAEFYRDPGFRAQVDATTARHPALREPLEKVGNQPTGLWVDTIAAVEQVPIWLGDAAEQSKARGHAVVPVLVVYDLPNRDCSAKASAGELSYEEDGERRYREEFIDVLAKHFAAFPDQRIVVILEPDSLPNVVTNLGVPKCALSEHVYKHSVAYAIAKLSLPNVYLYLDAAHSGWLGWDGNRAGMARVFKEVLDMAGGVDRIRGFATNVSNYTSLDGAEGKALEDSNPCPDELTYVTRLNESLTAAGIPNKGFIIDTSRNGRSDVRERWGNWCNIEGAGLGERPRANPAPLVDAYFWVKPPGESDGVADRSAARFDENCASADAAPGAPEAGEWFESYLLELVKNANPPL